jgi:hypothetical protein
MDLELSFANGVLTGHGADDIGRFLIRGRYNAATRECYWTKTYVGAHDVFYRGFREGKGIWGTWEITIPFHGGFHIWPRGAEEGEAETESAIQAEPVEAIAEELEPRAARMNAKSRSDRCYLRAPGRGFRETKRCLMNRMKVARPD